MAVHKLVSRRNILFVTLELLKADMNVFHFFTNCVPPQSVSVLTIYCNRFCDGLRHLEAKFVCANPILGFYLHNYPVSFLLKTGLSTEDVSLDAGRNGQHRTERSTEDAALNAGIETR